MIQLFKEPDGLTYALLNELHLWENNPRDVSEEDYFNLIRMTDLGEFEPLLVMVEDGTTLGGNTRSRVYREKGIEKVWISRVRFELGVEDQIWHAFVNDKEAKRTFETKEQAMLEYALASNSQAGRYNSQALAELAMPHQYHMPLEIYKVNLAYPVKMQSVLDSVQPAPNVPDPSTGDTVQRDPSKVDDWEDSYMNGTIRQIVLYFDVPQYQDVIQRLDTITKDLELENTTETFLELLEFYEAHPELHKSPEKTPEEPAEAEEVQSEENPSN